MAIGRCLVILCLLVYSVRCQEETTPAGEPEAEGESGSADFAADPRCYVCNSNTKDQENCADSSSEGFDNYAQVCKCPSTDGDSCDTSKVKPVGCRKVLQEVGKDEFVFRECAFNGPEEDGVKRTGNKDVRNFYYQCNGPTLCNGARSFAAISALLLITLLAYLF